MRNYFQRLERCTYYPRYRRLLGNRRRHGLDGWLSTSMPDVRLGLYDRMLARTVHWRRQVGTSARTGDRATHTISGCAPPRKCASSGRPDQIGRFF